MFAQGRGTWQENNDNVTEVTINAIKAGYRLFDCARFYANQKGVGEGIRKCIAEGIVKREELYIVSKVWNTDHEPAFVDASTRLTIEELGCGYLDLLLIHFPVAWVNPCGSPSNLKNQQSFYSPNETGCSKVIDVPILDTYRAMETLIDEGLVRDIGVSNFTIGELEHLLGGGGKGLKYLPVANQVEAHPSLPQKELRSYCKSKGIVVMAYCPLGIGFPKPGAGLIFNKDLKTIADRHGFNSTAALCLQWSSQMGMVCLSKSISPERIVENSKTPFGGISAEALTALDAFGSANHLRVCNPETFRESSQPFFVDSPQVT